jgi:hypothetical protein
MSEPFGFKVRHITEDGDTFEPVDQWKVELPHQCEAWTIAGVKYYDGVPHAEAVAELTRFIAEAQSALAALVERREVSA